MDKVKRRGYYAFNTQNKDKVELLFTMLFWARLEEKGYKIETMNDNLLGKSGVVSQLKTIAAIISAGHDNYCSKENTESKYTEEEFFEMLEEDITESVMQDILESMMKTKMFGKEINGRVRRLGKQKAVKNPQP